MISLLAINLTSKIVRRTLVRLNGRLFGVLALLTTLYQFSILFHFIQIYPYLDVYPQILCIFCLFLLGSLLNVALSTLFYCITCTQISFSVSLFFPRIRHRFCFYRKCMLFQNSLRFSFTGSRTFSLSMCL